ncbi:NADPH-dependent FMN reductase [Companilactobacillus sp. FL22-1]|uniref:NADPH-dependent FMN reductase n=1 Tax=Companilactobacillus sp. FL22-1 TaxID=3373892 RepID=UPI0037545773
MSLEIGIILGTARSNSLGENILNYLKTTFKDSAEVHYTWMPLKDYPLPFYDHEETPLEGHISNLNENEQAWLNTIAKQDGYIILSPEYDHGISGALKNALDFIGPEVDHKPVQIVTYSYYTDGGMLAARAIVPILQMLEMIVLPKPVLLWEASKNFTDQGELNLEVANSDHFQKRLNEAFEDLTFYTRILKNNPYFRKNN